MIPIPMNKVQLLELREIIEYRLIFHGTTLKLQRTNQRRQRMLGKIKRALQCELPSVSLQLTLDQLRDAEQLIHFRMTFTHQQAKLYPELAVCYKRIRLALRKHT